MCYVVEHPRFGVPYGIELGAVLVLLGVEVMLYPLESLFVLLCRRQIPQVHNLIVFKSTVVRVSSLSTEFTAAPPHCIALYLDDDRQVPAHCLDVMGHDIRRHVGDDWGLYFSKERGHPFVVIFDWDLCLIAQGVKRRDQGCGRVEHCGCVVLITLTILGLVLPWREKIRILQY